MRRSEKNHSIVEFGYSGKSITRADIFSMEYQNFTCKLFIFMYSSPCINNKIVIRCFVQEVFMRKISEASFSLINHTCMNLRRFFKCVALVGKWREFYIFGLFSPKKEIDNFRSLEMVANATRRITRLSVKQDHFAQVARLILSVFFVAFDE